MRESRRLACITLLAAALASATPAFTAPAFTAPQSVPQKAAVRSAEPGSPDADRPTAEKEGGKRILIENGTMLTFGDVLVNGPKGRTVFRWRDGITVAAGERAVALFSSEGAGVHPVRILLPALGGFTISFAAKPADRMKIAAFAAEMEAASVPARIRLYAGVDGSLFASVLEGAFTFRTKTDTHTIPAGGRILVSLDGTIAKADPEDRIEDVFGPEYTAWSSWNRTLEAKLADTTEMQVYARNVLGFAKDIAEAYSSTKTEYTVNRASYQSASEAWRTARSGESETGNEKKLRTQFFSLQDRHRDLASRMISLGRTARTILRILIPENRWTGINPPTPLSEAELLLKACTERLEALPDKP